MSLDRFLTTNIEMKNSGRKVGRNALSPNGPLEKGEGKIKHQLGLQSGKREDERADKRGAAKNELPVSHCGAILFNNSNWWSGFCVFRGFSSSFFCSHFTSLFNCVVIQ